MKHPFRGSTLLEAIIAILVIGFMLVLFSLALQNIPLLRATKNQELALKIVRTEIESLRAGGYDALPTSGTFTSPYLTSLVGASANLTISDFNDETKEVTVTVSWQEPKVSDAFSVSLTTLITQTGGL